MPLSFDHTSEDFVFVGGGRIKRFAFPETEAEALEILHAVRALTPRPKESATRPDALRADEHSRMIDEYVKNGGAIKQSTYDPLRREKKSRLKPKIIEATSGEELLSLLGIDAPTSHTI